MEPSRGSHSNDAGRESEAPAGRTRLAPIFLEALLVVLGVSLALAGEEWRNSRNARAHAERARGDIVDELRANAAALDEAHAYHAGLMDTLRTLAARPDAVATPALFPRGFVRPAMLMSTAWESARATDAFAEMPYEDVLAFSRAYAQQSRYEITARETGGVLYRDLMDYGAEGVAGRFRQLMSLIAAMWYTEGQLQTTYAEVLSQTAVD